MAQIVVVGGGIAGLGAAYTLQKAGVEVSVLEAAPEAGGRVRSKHWHGAWIDLGAEFIADADMTAFEKLAGELGLLDQRIVYPGEKVAFTIWRDGKAHPLSYTEPRSFLRFGAMSWWGKLRLLGLIPTLVKQSRRNGNTQFEPWRAAWCDDESTETWLSRLCPEFLEYAVEPCYELYCGYEPHDFGKGMFVYLTTQYRQTSIFTFKEGLGQLTRTLADQLDVTTGARVTRIGAGKTPVVINYEIDGKSERQEADLVIVAVPGTKVLGMVAGLDAARRWFFERVRYVPHELPFFKLSGEPVGIPANVFYPRKEDQEIAALGYDVSSTNPEVKFLRVSMKTGHIRRMLDRRDEEDLAAILAEAVRRYPQLKPLVEDRFVSRWRDALPVFWPGYCKALDQFVHLPPLPGVTFAGDYLAGPSTGSAYASGQRAAAEALRRLS